MGGKWRLLMHAHKHTHSQTCSQNTYMPTDSDTHTHTHTQWTRLLFSVSFLSKIVWLSRTQHRRMGAHGRNGFLWSELETPPAHKQQKWLHIQPAMMLTTVNCTVLPLLRQLGHVVDAFLKWEIKWLRVSTCICKGAQVSSLCMCYLHLKGVLLFF